MMLVLAFENAYLAQTNVLTFVLHSGDSEFDPFDLARLKTNFKAFRRGVGQWFLDMDRRAVIEIHQAGADDIREDRVRNARPVD